MSRLLAILLGLALPFALASCAASDNDYDDDDDGGDDDDDDNDDGGDDDDDGPPADASLSGTVVDEAGNPIEGIGVTCCSDERCINGTTAADGSFTISNLTANTYVVDNLSFPNNDILGWSKFFEFIEVGASEAVTVSRDLVLPEVTETVPDILEADESLVESPKTIVFQSGLQIDYDRVEAALPFNAVSLENPTLGVAEVPEANWPEGGMGSWNILQVWAFAPFEFGMEEEGDSFTVHAPLAEALEVGTEVGVLWADYDEGIITESFMEAAATLSPDGMVVSGEVHKLSLLIIATAGS